MDISLERAKNVSNIAHLEAKLEKMGDISGECDIVENITYRALSEALIKNRADLVLIDKTEEINSLMSTEGFEINEEKFTEVLHKIDDYLGRGITTSDSTDSDITTEYPHLRNFLFHD